MGIGVEELLRAHAGLSKIWQIGTGCQKNRDHTTDQTIRDYCLALISHVLGHQQRSENENERRRRHNESDSESAKASELSEDGSTGLCPRVAGIMLAGICRLYGDKIDHYYTDVCNTYVKLIRLSTIKVQRQSNRIARERRQPPRRQPPRLASSGVVAACAMEEDNESIASDTALAVGAFSINDAHAMWLQDELDEFERMDWLNKKNVNKLINPNEKLTEKNLRSIDFSSWEGEDDLALLNADEPITSGRKNKKNENNNVDNENNNNIENEDNDELPMMTDDIDDSLQYVNSQFGKSRMVDYQGEISETENNENLEHEENDSIREISKQNIDDHFCLNETTTADGIIPPSENRDEVESDSVNKNKMSESDVDFETLNLTNSEFLLMTMSENENIDSIIERITQIPNETTRPRKARQKNKQEAIHEVTVKKQLPRAQLEELIFDQPGKGIGASIGYPTSIFGPSRFCGPHSDNVKRMALTSWYTFASIQNQALNSTAPFEFLNHVQKIYPDLYSGTSQLTKRFEAEKEKNQQNNSNNNSDDDNEDRTMNVDESDPPNRQDDHSVLNKSDLEFNDVEKLINKFGKLNDSLLNSHLNEDELSEPSSFAIEEPRGYRERNGLNRVTEFGNITPSDRAGERNSLADSGRVSSEGINSHHLNHEFDNLFSLNIDSELSPINSLEHLSSNSSSDQNNKNYSAGIWNLQNFIFEHTNEMKKRNPHLNSIPIDFEVLLKDDENENNNFEDNRIRSKRKRLRAAVTFSNLLFLLNKGSVVVDPQLTPSHPITIRVATIGSSIGTLSSSSATESLSIQDVDKENWTPSNITPQQIIPSEKLNVSFGGTKKRPRRN